MRTHYDNLHVKENASLEVIRGAYKTLAQKWRPDKNPDLREKAQRNFKIIKRAFEVLSDPEVRTKYDAWLAEQRINEALSSPDLVVNEINDPPPEHARTRGQMAEAWEDGRRSREQGFRAVDCPYSDDLAGAWQQGFKAGAPTSKSPHTTHAKTSLLKRLWRGEISLGKTFWLYGFLGSNLFVLACFIVLLASAAYVHGNYTDAVLVAMLRAPTFGVIYGIFICICIWRSAGRNRALGFWGVAARIFCLTPLIGGAAAVIIPAAFERNTSGSAAPVMRSEQFSPQPQQPSAQTANVAETPTEAVDPEIAEALNYAISKYPFLNH
jgi:hypothetical protein